MALGDDGPAREAREIAELLLSRRTR
jgi:hypothetical protein